MTAFNPHDYQKQAIKFLLGQGAAGLLLSPGSGKTSITYAALKVLREKGMMRRALVIAPLRPAVSVWPREAAKWDDFQAFKVNVLHGKGKTVANLLDADVAVINFEGIEWIAEVTKGMRDFPFDVLVIDELSKCRHGNTTRFRTLKPMLPKFKRRWGLTGSPATNGLEGLWGQMYVLDLGAALGRYVTHFRNEHFDKVGYGGYTLKLKDGADQRIYEAIRPLCYRLSTSELLKLPPLIYNTVEVDLPAEAVRAYREMEALLTTTLAETTITAAGAAAATQKCQQIANGGAYYLDDAGERKWKHIHSAKVDAIVDLVEELQGEPAFIAYGFQHDLDRLQKAFPDAPHIGGGTSSKHQLEVEDAWNAGKLPVLLVQPQAMGHGVNCQGTAGSVIWCGPPFDLGVWEQLIARVWRQGQQHPVTVHSVVARGTVDMTILRVLASKARTQTALLDALREDLLK